MKNHEWRPLLVVLGIVAVILIARLFIVPEDFGVGEQGYMYGYHRLGNEQEWKDYPIGYRTTVYCGECHGEIVDSRNGSLHAIVPCENCHGPARNHPEEPPALALDRSRDLCLRCHAYLPYPGSDRKKLTGIDPEQHNPEFACLDCHDPHRPNLEEM